MGYPVIAELMAAFIHLIIPQTFRRGTQEGQDTLYGVFGSLSVPGVDRIPAYRFLRHLTRSKRVSLFHLLYLLQISVNIYVKYLNMGMFKYAILDKVILIFSLPSFS
jgi:hypothetical protein